MAITGIIRPPPDIRAVADKTALFVAKNGRAFEQRILNSGKGQTPKFAFLHENSPFHAYYEDRIKFYQEGGTDEEKKDGKKKDEERKGHENKAPVTAIIKKASQQSEKKSALDPVAKALLDQRHKIRTEFEAAEKARREDTRASNDTENNNPGKLPPVHITPPPHLHYVSITAPTNLTAVQIETIKLVAQFIALDESKNFLQNLTIREWNNPMFAFLQPRHAHFAYFSALTDCYKHIVHIALKESGFQRQSLQDLLEMAAYRAEYDHHMAQRQVEGGQDEDMEAIATIDWHDFVVVETIDFPKDEAIALPTAPPAGAAADDMGEETDEEGETIRVVPNYTPKVVASSQSTKSRTHVIDPITGRSVPAAQTSEHMRIQLLDPKWAEEKRKFQEKQKETNLVAGDAIATNLSRVVGEPSDSPDLKRRHDDNMPPQQPGPLLPPPIDQAAKRQRVDYLPPPPLPPPGFPPAGNNMMLPPPGMPPLPPGMPPLPPAAGMPPRGMPPESFDPNVEGPSPEESLLMPAADFAATLESPEVTLEIAIPHDASNMAWNFYGQSVGLKVNVMSNMKAIKEELAGHLNDISINKLQLKHAVHGFLNKDTVSLADLNLGPLVSLEMVPKTSQPAILSRS